MALSMLLVLQLDAQSPRVWYFGQKAGINFVNNINIVTLNDNQMSTPEGCATFESLPGIPMLYSNGEKIWHHTGQLLNNGTNLNGSINSCQSALFYLPPKFDTIYLFTTDAHNGGNGLCYSTLDNSSTLPNVALKNVSLLSSATERMTLARHCNLKSTWLITHQWNSDAFYSYKIEDTGLDFNPIISNVGSVHNGNTINAKGCIKVSLSGSKLALAKMADGVVEVFHFNNATGEVYDPILITGIPNAYGVEFSHSGFVLYVTTASGQLLQFSLANWNQTAIQNSKIVLSSQAQLLGSLQIGPDKKIYVSKDNSYYLGRIENPLVMGNNCTYNPTAIHLNGRKCEAGLPQINLVPFNYSFGVPKVCIGDTSIFSFGGDSTRVDSVMYYFGENPIYDSTKIFNPKYCFNSIGDHIVALVVYHCDTTDTIFRLARVIGSPNIDLGPDKSFCENEIKSITGSLAANYLWDDGSTSATRYIDSAGIYWLKVTNDCGSDIDTIEILNIFTTPPISLPPDTTICIGDSVVLDAGNDSLSNLWQGYYTTRYFTAITEGLYQLEITDTNNCTSNDDFYLKVLFPPEIDLGSDTNICIGKDLTFNGSSIGHYVWQNNTTDTSMHVSEPGLYYVNITNICGEASDSCMVTYSECNQVIWVPNAFTPNADGINDGFLPYIENVSNYHLMIFNRWGKLIFETSNPLQAWDGTYNGDRAPDDSYNWRIDYTNYSGDSFNQYGFVILFR